MAKFMEEALAAFIAVFPEREPYRGSMFEAAEGECHVVMRFVGDSELRIKVVAVEERTTMEVFGQVDALKEEMLRRYPGTIKMFGAAEGQLKEWVRTKIEGDECYLFGKIELQIFFVKVDCDRTRTQEVLPLFKEFGADTKMRWVRKYLGSQISRGYVAGDLFLAQGMHAGVVAYDRGAAVDLDGALKDVYFPYECGVVIEMWQPFVVA